MNLETSSNVYAYPHPGPLPRGEGDRTSPLLKDSHCGCNSSVLNCPRLVDRPNAGTILPLPGGEGWGEGKRIYQHTLRTRTTKRFQQSNIPVCGFMGLSSPVFLFLKLGTGKFPEPAGWKACATFCADQRRLV